MKRMWTMVLLASLGSTLGCGATSLEVAPDMPTEFTKPGIYAVAAVPSVQFPLSKVHFATSGVSVSLYYELPAELVGKTTPVELTGTLAPDGTITLSGDLGTSTCTVSATLLHCEEHLTGLHPTALPAGASQADQVAARSFTDDPIGELSVPFPVQQRISGGPPTNTKE